ncbi:MAG: 50S ribosomal protein L29 [Planctomycetes bacterium]|nr:50S ribosomal protein L29 [Planctomycetota bacterium]MBU1517314.1 50S ribosomal protein L29 [Planctomycetota bacterium]MBU2458418.1 50S ribosomal protein L29 [Planctomycetota bacterium]MBU2596446.1 50S ribosomal protein L29 [Planctomycetota bacterium]
MKVSEIREMRPDERQSELEKLKKALFNLRTRAETEKLENTQLLKNMKRDIARFKTIIRQGQLKG